MKKYFETILIHKVTQILLQILVIISIVGFSLETLPNLSSSTKGLLRYIELIIIIFFTFEYILRIYISKRKIKFIFSFFWIIDFLAIVPFYLSTGLDLRSLRILRIFRLFTVFKLLRYSKAIKNFKEIIISIREELIIFSILTFILIFFSAIWIYYFENEAQPENFSSIFDSLWWAVVTLTTVWYWDLYPITAWWRFFAFVIVIIWLGIVAIPTWLIAGAISEKK